MRDVVIVAMGRSAITKVNRGGLAKIRPEELGAQVLSGVLEKVPNLPLSKIDDVIVGCAFPEGEQGMNIAKVISQMAGLPITVSGQTVNRFCSSGLQTIATAANAIACGQGDIIIAGGIESMSTIPMGGNIIRPITSRVIDNPSEWSTMGITAENVATKYQVSREAQDAFAAESHKRAIAAIDAGKFKEQIIPVSAPQTKNVNGLIETVYNDVLVDDCIRRETTVEGLAKLRPCFKADGSVTAANASQMSDGAAFVVLMERELANSYNLEILGSFKGFAVAGVDPKYMGIGPIDAINKVLERYGLNAADIELYELNEAFASQAIATINELGLSSEIVNVNGGAIALGHPLGCTGTFLTIKLLSEMIERDAHTGIVSMCIGGGMGAAGIFER